MVESSLGSEGRRAGVAHTIFLLRFFENDLSFMTVNGDVVMKSWQLIAVNGALKNQSKDCFKHNNF